MKPTALAKERQEKAFKTMQIFLGQPMVEERLRKKGRIRILDFGCSDGSASMGIANAVAKRFASKGLLRLLSPTKIELVGIDSSGKTEESTTEMRGAKIHAIFIRPLEMLACAEEIRYRPGKFDIITSFNPSPPIDILEQIHATNKAMHFSGKASPETEMFDEMRGPIIRLLAERLGIGLEWTNHVPLYPLLEAMKSLIVNIQFQNIFPELLAKDGIVLVAADSLLGPETIRRMLPAEVYRIFLDRENDEDNIFCPGGSDFNRYMFGAILCQ